MSVQPEEREAIELPRTDVAFGALMDALAPEEEGSAAGGAGGADAGAGVAAEAGAARGAAGGHEAAAAGAAAAGRAAEGQGGGTGEQVDGAAGHAGGDPEQPAAPGAPAAGAEPADAAAVVPLISGLSTRIEENMVRGYQTHAYEAVRNQYGKYFEALEVHPRMLAGREVPSVNSEGMEVLKDASDAREWQDAVRTLLTQEIEAKAQGWVQNASGFLETIHANVDLFTKNPDLIPGTKMFDKALADEFASMMKPYEVRIEGKLQGYSIPTQPIIDKLRSMQPARAAAAPVAAKAPKAEAPQAAIRSKAATGEGPEDFSTLFGTIGLPQLRI